MKDLNKDYTERLKACKKLEKAASKLIRTAVKAKHKDDRVQAKAYHKSHEAEVKQHAKEAKAQGKQQQGEVKKGRKEGKRDFKTLEKRGQEGDAEAHQAEEYMQAHGTVPLSPRTAPSDTDHARPSADTSLTAVGSPSLSEYGERKGSVSHDEDSRGQKNGVDNGTDGRIGVSRPQRRRTTTSELEAGQLPSSPTLSSGQQFGAGDGGGEDGRQASNSDEDAERLLELYAPPAKRPRHRTGFMGLFGAKVDSIEFYKVRPFTFLHIVTDDSIGYSVCT